MYIKDRTKYEELGKLISEKYREYINVTSQDQGEIAQKMQDDLDFKLSTLMQYVSSINKGYTHNYLPLNPDVNQQRRKLEKLSAFFNATDVPFDDKRVIMTKELYGGFFHFAKIDNERLALLEERIRKIL